MKIGVIGYGPFGKFLTQLLLQRNDISVRVVNRLDSSYIDDLKNNKSEVDLRCKLYKGWEELVSFAADLDAILLAVSIASLEGVLEGCPVEIFRNKLVVDVCSVKMHPRDIMQGLLPPSADILCTHPMFGPRSAGGAQGLAGKIFMYDIIRVRDTARCEFFLNIWKTLQCDLIEMTCEAHDEYAAKSQFVTHFVARSLDAYSLEHTPIDTPSYRNLCDLTAGLCEDSPDLFMALFRFNPFASSQLQKMKDALNTIELQLTGPDLASAVPLRATSSSS